MKQSHFVFNRSTTKKPRRRLGNLQQSEWDTLDQMLVGHRKEVQDLLLERKNDFTEDTEDFVTQRSISEFCGILLSRTVYGDMGRRAYRLLIEPLYNHLTRPDVAEKINVSSADDVTPD